MNGVASGTPTTYYYHPDHLGSTNAITNSAGTVKQALDYYPYGAQRINTGTDASDRRFIGQFADDATSLDYLNARYYDPARGQFTSQDPSFLSVGDPNQIKQLTGRDQQAFLADPHLANSYGYGRDNPIVMKDPNGLDPYSSMQLWLAYNSSPEMAAAKQQLLRQLQSGYQGALTAGKFSGAVVASGVAAGTNPATLPYVLGGWANVGASVYEDYQNGTIDTSRNSYAGDFALGAGQETRFIQSGGVVSVLAKSTALSAFGSTVLNGTVSTRSLLSNAAGTLAGRITQAAGSYAAGSAMNATLMLKTIDG